jgi:hypothetical protein
VTSLIVLLDSAAINGPTPFQIACRAVGKPDRLRMNGQVWGHSFYQRPVVKAPLSPQGGVLIQYVQPPQAAIRFTRYELRPPRVVTIPVAFIATPIKVTLADQIIRITRKRAQHRLAAPVAVYVIPLNFGPGVRTTAIRPPAVRSELRPPTVVSSGVTFVATPIKVTLVDQSDDAQILANQRRTLSRLRGPLYVVEPVVANISPGGPGVRLADSSRGRPKSELRSPVVVATATTAIFFGPQVALAKIRPPLTKPRLEAPAVIGGSIAYGGPRVRLTAPRDRNPAVHSRLEPPTVVTTTVVVVYYGPKVTLTRIRRVRTLARLLPVPAAFQPIGFAVRVDLVRIRPVATRPVLRKPVVIDLRPQVYYPSVTLVRITPPPTMARLFPPTDLVDRQDVGRVRVTLAASFRGRPKSELRPPTLIDLTPQVYTVAVTLVRIRPVSVRSVLREPTDLIDTQDLGAVAVSLVRIRPVATRSVVRVPVVIDLRPQAYYLAVTLAPQRRGVPKSKLAPPVVVTSGVVVVYYGPKVTLTRIRPVRTIARLLPVPAAFRPVGSVAVTLAPQKRGTPKSILRRPIDLVDRDDLGFVRVHLAYQSRRPGRTELRPPVVIDLRPQTYYVSVALVRIRPVRTIVRLEPPTDLVDQQDLGRVRVTLAPQKRGTPKSRLEPPTLIDLSPQVYYLTVELAPSFRGKPKPILGKPTDLVDAQDLGFAQITLVRIRPVPTQHIVRRPIDLIDRDDLGFVRVHLAYQSRGKPKSLLRKPTVIDLRPQTYYVSLTLAPSRYPKPKSILRPDSKFAPKPQADYTILLHLAYQTRGKPKSKLRPPAVVGAGIYFRGIRIKLAPSRFPKPKSRLQRVPPAFRPVGFTAITLAPSRFPRPKSVLRKPTVVQAFRIPYISVTLVRIRPVAVHSALRRPTDLVDRQDLGFVRVHLAPSRFPVPHSRLEPPTIVRQFVARPTRVTLAPQRRGVPRSFLKPPTVVGAAEAFFGPSVTLVRIRPVPTISFFQTGAVAPTCYGDVVGFDFAPEVCGSDEGATVTGTTSAGQTVSGSDSGATVQGASAPGGSVTGGDTKREGC